MAPIVTLTSDFGTRDFYAATLKGAILSHNPEIQLVDIAHHIDPYNIAEAAFIIRNAYKSFPKGTLHLINVSDHDDPDCRYLLIQHDDHYFLGSDNGLFSLSFETEPELAFEPFDLQNADNDLNKQIAKVVGRVLNGEPLTDIGKPVYQIRQLRNIEPVVESALIRGTVIYVDRFENVITNICRDLFDEVRNDRRFIIYFKRTERISEVSTHFYDVPEGEKLCIFNEAGYLEIAINKGKASSLLGLKVGDNVQIDFE